MHLKEKHHGAVPVINPCPLADREECGELFASPLLAVIHANAVHYGQFPCSNHEESGRKGMFADTTSADKHERGYIRYLCSVPQCVDAVMGRARHRCGFAIHEQQHKDSGHFSNLMDVPNPTEVVFPAGYAGEDHGSDLVLDEANTIDDFEADDSSVEEDFHWGRSLAMIPLAQVTFAIDTIEERKRPLPERNQKLLDSKYGYLQSSP